MRGPSCPACLAPGLSGARRVSPRIEIHRCGSCGHRIGIHRACPAAPPDQDIHAQYGQGRFLDALRATRVRQTRLALGIIERHEPEPDALLDYGSGRGWLIEGAREAGYRRLAGADISELAVRWLRESGVAAIRLAPGGSDPGAALGELPFRPRILSLMDVVEHFAPEEVDVTLASLARALSPELRWILIKAPCSQGLLYRTASVLAGLGQPGFLEKLWQVGSLTPHHHYFSVRSAQALVARMGWKLVESPGDSDFEPEHLLARAGIGGAWPVLLSRAAGLGVMASVQALGLYDTRFYLVSVR